MKQILLPTDFSVNATNALDYALYIAKKTGATLTLLNVTQMPPGSSTMHRNIRDILKKDSEDALSELRESIKADAANQDVNLQTISRYGTFEVQVKAVVEDLDIDLIVMGTQGATGIAGILFGSNTATIIEEVTACPVLAIPHKAPIDDIHKIVFATTYAGNNIEILKDLSALAAVFGASIQILHVRITKEGTKTQIIEDFKQKLRKEVPKESFTFHEVEHEDVLEGLLEFVKANNIDLIAMGTRKKGFFGFFMRSLTKSAAFSTTVPLMAFHDKPKD
jgi:nucleotide-binding universal stress UspA family protein